MRVKDAMTANCRVLRGDATLQEVASIFLENQFDGAPVTNHEGKMIGLFTKSHLFKAIASGQDPTRTRVGELMRASVISVTEDANIMEAWKVRVGRLPVVNKDGQLTGILTRTDLCQAFVQRWQDTTDQLLALLNSTHNGIIAVDNLGRITTFNTAAERLVGTKAKQVLGRHINEVIHASQLTEVLETGTPQFGKKLLINNATVVTNRTPITHGEDIVGAVGVFQDISDLEAIAKELASVKELNQELNAIIDSVADGIIVADGQGIITRVNPAYECLAGVKEEDYLGKHVRQLIEEGFVSDSVTLEVVRTKKPANIMQRVRIGKDLLNSAVPIFNDQGELARVVTIIRDLTELNNLRKQLEESKALTEEYRDKLEKVQKEDIEKQVVIHSPEIRELFALAKRVAPTDVTVLIMGESGVGKELVARLIHENSSRYIGPFIKVNCGAIPGNLLESELFGYEDGAFTGAKKGGKRGLLEAANGGTFLLDEVGEMSMDLQVKLLRVLQEKEYTRIGGNNPIRLNVRFLAATNRDLKQMVQKGEFREDLFYRLNVVPLVVPSLRDRTADVAPLIMFFLKQFNEKYRQNKRVSPETIEALTRYEWPGNIRELENIIERLVVTCHEDLITPNVLQAYGMGYVDMGQSLSAKEPGGLPANMTLKHIMEKNERNLILEAYQRCRSTRKAAELLGINQSTVVKKMKKYGLRCQLE
ncbi:hypothetical protein SY88_20680 [Clostridiales bacterium PH28_bin88]|nr:hypothetical protein SY88_20680 [Clostridiales bacterium PH28_bin88]